MAIEKEDGSNLLWAMGLAGYSIYNVEEAMVETIIDIKRMCVDYGLLFPAVMQKVEDRSTIKEGG